MQAFNKFAGVSEVSSKPLPPAPAIPQDEPSTEALSRRASRASLPRDLTRTPSRRSLRSNHQLASARRSEEIPPLPITPGLQSIYQQKSRNSTRQDISAESEATPAGRISHESAASGEEFVWGPSHPCFPHPNPHCLPESEEYANTRVIRVRRDWLVAGDLYPQFQNLYPEILDPLVSDHDFRFFVTNINARLERMFDPWSTRAWIDATLGLLTGFLYDDLGLTGTKRGIRDLEVFIDKWNAQKVSEKQDVRVIQPRRTGFMSLDFVIPDPGLDAIDPAPQSADLPES